MRIAFAGQGALGAAVLGATERAGHDVVAVIGDARRRRPLDRDAVRRRATAWVQEADADEASRLLDRVDLLLVADFGRIFHEAWAEVPRLGALNVHWSLLPLHRGPVPHTGCLLAGDAESGVTFHGLVRRVDGGPIVDQASFSLDAREDAMSLYRRAAELAGERTPTVLARVASDGVVGRQQPPGGSYQRRLRPDQLRLDWTRKTIELDRLVRAVTWPRPWTTWGRRRLQILSATPTTGAGEPGTLLSVGPPVVATGDGALRIDGAIGRWGAGWPGLGGRATAGLRLGQ